MKTVIGQQKINVDLDRIKQENPRLYASIEAKNKALENNKPIRK